MKGKKKGCSFEVALSRTASFTPDVMFTKPLSKGCGTIILYDRISSLPQKRACAHIHFFERLAFLYFIDVYAIAAARRVNHFPASEVHTHMRDLSFALTFGKE